jgi:hypothetical protein
MPAKRRAKGKAINDPGNEIMRLYTKRERLLPELREYVHASGPLLVLSHPYLTYPDLNPEYAALANAQYREKAKAVAEAKAQRDWHSLILLYNRPFRFSLFDEIAGELSDAEYWQLLGEVWMDSESLRDEQRLIAKHLTSDRPERHHLMTEEERAVLAGLPDQLTVYRGRKRNVKSVVGWSWTLSEEKGRWYACRFYEPGYLVTGSVAKADVVAYFGRRNEAEVVASPKCVTVTETVAVEPDFDEEE